MGVCVHVCAYSCACSCAYGVIELFKSSIKQHDNCYEFMVKHFTLHMSVQTETSGQIVFNSSDVIPKHVSSWHAITTSQLRYRNWHLLVLHSWHFALTLFVTLNYLVHVHCIRSKYKFKTSYTCEVGAAICQICGAINLFNAHVILLQINRVQLSGRQKAFNYGGGGGVG